jgi:hypothetical protein
MPLWPTLRFAWHTVEPIIRGSNSSGESSENARTTMTEVDPRAHKLMLDAAEWDVQIGWGTGTALTLLRAVLLIGFLTSSPRDWSLFVQIAVQLLLSGAFTVGVYRRHGWAATGLLVTWGIGYFYSWAMSGRLIPPLALIGILIWYGLYRGLRGTRKLAAVQNASVAAG